MGTPAILTWDLGTTACKAALFTADGDLLATAQAPVPTTYPQPTWAEQDPAAWWQAVLDTGRAVLAAPAARGVRVAAIGLSSQRETIVPVGPDGQPLGPAVLWMDRRAVEEAAELGAALGAEAIRAVTGLLPEATFSAAKILWLRRNQPDVFRRARWFLQPKDYLILRLTGAPALDPSLASRSLCYDIRAGRWWAPMLEHLGLNPERLPPVVPSGAAAGTLLPQVAAALDLPPGIPVAAGGGDRACEALGAAVAGGRVMVSTGTATNVSAAVAALPPGALAGVLVSVHVLPGQWLLEQGISTGGAVLRWLRDLLGEADYAALDAAAAGTPPGSRGLVLLPYFLGARATRWNPAARGAVFGLTLAHGRGDLARAAMEGLALEVRRCLDVLAGHGVHVAEVVALGGGARSALWAQIQAHATGRTVAVPVQTESASLGAMALAARAAGLVADPLALARRANPPVRTYTPDPAHTAFYGELLALYDDLYAALAPLYERLGALASRAPAPAPPGGAG